MSHVASCYQDDEDFGLLEISGARKLSGCPQLIMNFTFWRAFFWDGLGIQKSVIKASGGFV